MKNIVFLFIFLSLIFVVMGCDHNIDPNNNHNNIPLESIRNVAEDPVIDCIVEQVHQHNGIYYAGHYNNDIHGHHGLTADNICTLTSCQKTSLHEHNGIHYAGHHGLNDHHGNGHH